MITEPSARAHPFPIVGIGASAGGLEAVSRLLAHLPPDTGMAFVVVQHLDPSRESLLPMILQKATKMPVAHAKDSDLVEPNRVYVIPPATHMRVADGRLELIPRPEGIYALSVNCFLTSLAEERGNRAVAVILSGSASDGALGVKAVKAEGGVVFAQDERSSAHFSMPQSAAATGAVDFVLPPEEIAAELARMALHPVMGPDVATLFEDPKSLGQIFLLLRRATGVDFGLYKPSTIKRRLLRRLMVHKLNRLEQYVELLEKRTGEVRALHDDLLIHVTHFFREPQTLETVRAKVFPRILKDVSGDAPIRVWVPGCSTGEEAYTLAIELLDFLSERDSPNALQIFATDVSEVALERARAGVYSEDIQNHVPPRYLRRFFTKTDRGYAVVKRLRDACVFARQDLTKDPPFAAVDIISCCNVLIYLGPEAQKQVLPMFHYALRPSGALILGKAESAASYEDLFELVDKESHVYFKKAAPTRIPFSMTVRRIAAQPKDGSGAVKANAAVAPGWPETDVQRVADRILLTRFAPAGVIVNEDLNILQFRGRVNRYLEPATGKPSVELLKMLPAHSAARVKALLAKAKKSDSPAKTRDIELDEEGTRSPSLIDVEVVPFRLPISGERYYIVLFEEASGARPKAARPAAPKEGVRVKRLKNELASTRSYLQTIVEEHEAATEELKSANEEIISSNEELQSTNEELEIAKEELQAANEELSTVNEELQTRNNDLGLLSNDLLNLISSVHLAILMISTDLRIRRFSPMAEKLMNLIPGDVGRPIADIKLKIELPNIEEIIHDVMETALTKELDVRDAMGRAYSLRVRPYKTTENKIEGVVLVFMDNDPVKRSLQEIKQDSAFEALMDVTDRPVVILDSQMRVKTGSRSLYQSFGLTESQLGHSLFEIAEGRWNVPELRSALERLTRKGEPFSRVPAVIGGRTLSLSGRRIEAKGDAQPMTLLSISEPA